MSTIHHIRTGSGPPVILLHGLPGTHSFWHPLCQGLSVRHTLYALDLPGFGGSPPASLDGQDTLSALARIVISFAAELGLEQFDLIGHSFGGALAATVAGRHPDRVRTLCLLTPLGMRQPPAARILSSPPGALAGPVWRAMPEKFRRLMVTRAARVTYGQAFTGERAGELAGELCRPDLPRTVRDLIGNVDFIQYRQTLSRLNERHAMPVMLVTAGRDRVVPPSHQQAVGALLSRAQQHSFPDGDHVVVWQYRTELNSLIDRFINTFQ